MGGTECRNTHLPLAREVAVTRRDTEEESVVVCELVRCDDGVRRLGRRVQEFENVF